MSEPPVLTAENVVKRYGHVYALRGANFSVRAGEVVALVGDNGAGKSTLVKVLSGTLRPDEGQLSLDGRPIRLHGPLDAQRHGIETVYQDLALAADLDAAANLHLGREVVRGGPLGWLGVLDKPAMRTAARQAVHELGIELPDVTAPVRTLSGGQRQCVAVARAVAGQVLDVIRRVRDRGLAVVLISHNMPEVLAVADRVEVLRLGRRVARLTAADTSVEELVSAMTGGIDTENGTTPDPRSNPNGSGPAEADAKTGTDERTAPDGRTGADESTGSDEESGAAG